MQVGLHQFHADTIEWLSKAVLEEGRTRSSLARDLCALEDWTGDRGEHCLASARKALPVLADKLGLALPAARAAFGRGRREGAAIEAFPDLSLRCRLTDLGSVTLELVDGDAERRLWQAMIATHHPQGWARAPGGQLRYWVRSSLHGRLGGIGFCAASWHQKARDDFIGWSADARALNLPLAINNHRFLLLPGVRVHGLASRVLELAAGRVAADWEAAYTARPVLAYSYVGPDHAGTCYRAAGWRCCSQHTSGQPPGSAAGAARTVWMKPLAADWQAILCAEPARDIRAAPALHMDEDTDWAGREYARSTHPDGRVRDRIERMGRAWLERPGAAIPAIFPAKPDRKAAYRLLSSGKVSMEHILEPHQATMVERCQLEDIVLAIQDTTTLNYDGLAATEGLVGVGGGGKGACGLVAHVGLAVNVAGRPLGVFALDATFRDGNDEDRESVRWEHGHDRAQELARACPATQVVNGLRPGSRHLGVARNCGVPRRRAPRAREPFAATKGHPGDRREGGPVEACRRSPAPCRQDRGDRRLRRQAGAVQAYGNARAARRPGSAWRHRATPRARSRSTCSPCPRPNPTRPPARTRSTGCCSAPRAAPTPRPPRPSSPGTSADGPSRSTSRS